jgi:hypothetical protein
MRPEFVAIACAVACACGGASAPQWPADGTVRIALTRRDPAPGYQCQGTVQTRPGTASFSCTAEGFGRWGVTGSAERSELYDVLRLWIRAADGPHSTGQPDIAVDLQPDDDHYSGWATVILPDGTGFGHFGASATAWVGK